MPEHHGACGACGSAATIGLCQDCGRFLCAHSIPCPKEVKWGGPGAYSLDSVTCMTHPHLPVLDGSAADDGHLHVEPEGHGDPPVFSCWGILRGVL